MHKDLASGKQREPAGILEHWLKEGKISANTAMHESKDLFAAAVDTVSLAIDILLSSDQSE